MMKLIERSLFFAAIMFPASEAFSQNQNALPNINQRAALPACTITQFDDLANQGSNALQQLDAAYQECRKLPIDEKKCRALSEIACTTSKNYLANLKVCSLGGWDPLIAGLLLQIALLLEFAEDPKNLEDFSGQPFACLANYGYSDPKWWEIHIWM